MSDVLKERMDKLETKLETENQALKTTLTTFQAKLEEKHTEHGEGVQTPVAPGERSQQSGHKNIAEIVDCPNCYPEIERLVTPKVLKKYGESLKGLETVKCKGCGLHVRREEDKCPACGSSDAE